MTPDEEPPAGGDAATLREARAGDVPVLAVLYADTVRALGPAGYTPRQVETWAQSASDTQRFRDFVLVPRTLVLEDTRGILGFCGIEDDGHVASLYVHADHTGRGVGTALLEAALGRARERGAAEFHAEASLFSLPVFRRCGFLHYATERVGFAGVEFDRYLVATAPPANRPPPRNRRHGT